MIHSKKIDPKLQENIRQHFFNENGLKANVNVMEGENLKIVKCDDKGKVKFFLVKEILGAGAFGEVSRGYELNIETGELQDNKPVAIKITDLSEGGTLGRKDRELAAQDSRNENNCLQILQQSLGYSEGQRMKMVSVDMGDGVVLPPKNTEVTETVTVMPLFSGRDVGKHKYSATYGSVTKVDLAKQLIQDLDNIHTHDVLHADLKPANIIWNTEAGMARIVDFNRAKIMKKGESVFYDTKASDTDYMAPESFLSPEQSKARQAAYAYSKAADIYSAGKILFEKLGLKGKTYYGYSDLFLNRCVERMMSAVPSKRPSAKSIGAELSKLQAKMNLDIEDPKNPLRRKLNSELISLEIYANKLRKEQLKNLNKSNTQKYNLVLNMMNDIILEMANKKINAKKLNVKMKHYQKDFNSFSFFSFFKRDSTLTKLITKVTSILNAATPTLKNSEKNAKNMALLMTNKLATVDDVLKLSEEGMLRQIYLGSEKNKLNKFEKTMREKVARGSRDYQLDLIERGLTTISNKKEMGELSEAEAAQAIRGLFLFIKYQLDKEWQVIPLASRLQELTNRCLNSPALNVVHVDARQCIQAYKMMFDEKPVRAAHTKAELLKCMKSESWLQEQDKLHNKNLRANQ